MFVKKKSVVCLKNLCCQILEINMIILTETIKDKNLFYRNSDYEYKLKIRGENYLIESSIDITNDCKFIYESLFTIIQTVPQDILFRNNLFKEICNKIWNWNETRIVKNILLLIVSSVEIFAIYDITELKFLIFNINKYWDEFVFITEICSQSDYCIEFNNSVFNWLQY